MRARFWVGHCQGKKEVFKATERPTEQSHPQYMAVVGPFKTRRGAVFMAKNGWNNPHCRTVADAERLAKNETPH